MSAPMFGKTIRLFLVEGNPNGLITAELSNWTGKAIKIPRIKVKEYANREELQKPGVYILFGKNEKLVDSAYIGEAEKIVDRLLDHLAKKDFWNEAVVFISKDKYLNKASIRYLEHRLHSIGNNAARFDIINNNIPTKSELSEAEQAELEEFLAHIKLLTSSLGHRIFEEIEETLERNKKEEEIFFCVNSQGVKASGAPSTEGFIVFKGSTFSKQRHPSLTESIQVQREAMLRDGTLMEEEANYTLTKHYNFNSSSRAAEMILGRSASGPLEWKNEKNVQLKHFEISRSS